MVPSRPLPMPEPTPPSTRARRLATAVAAAAAVVLGALLLIAGSAIPRRLGLDDVAGTVTMLLIRGAGLLVLLGAGTLLTRMSSEP